MLVSRLHESYVLLHAKRSLQGRHHDSHPHAACKTVPRQLGRPDRWLRATVPAQIKLLTKGRSPRTAHGKCRYLLLRSVSTTPCLVAGVLNRRITDTPSQTLHGPAWRRGRPARATVAHCSSLWQTAMYQAGAPRGRTQVRHQIKMMGLLEAIDTGVRVASRVLPSHGPFDGMSPKQSGRVSACSLSGDT
jgi:hypothetical protein